MATTTIINGTSGNDTLVGGNGSSTINGGAGNDTIIAGNAGDTMDGGSGSDTMLGGNGKDTFIETINENYLSYDRMDGGNGKDILILRGTAHQFQLLSQAIADWQASNKSQTFHFGLYANGILNLDITNVETLQLVTIANSAPIAVHDTASVSESITPNATVDLVGNVLSNDYDPDVGDVIQVISLAPMVGAYGTLVLQANGSYAYSFNNTTSEALAQGDIVHETFTYIISDGQGGTATATIQIAITGTNDAAIITVVDDAGHVKEDVTTSDSGKLNVADVDHGEAIFKPLSQSGIYGNFSIDQDGNWTYTLRNGDANVQALREGEQHTETFTVSSLDGTATHDVTVTIVGTNDIAVISGNASGNVKEDISLSTLGKVDVADVDHDEAFFVPLSQSGVYGNFNMDANGNWTYSLRNGDVNVQALAEGEQHTETFMVSSLDGTATQAINVTVVGTNDPAVITVVDTSGNVKEDITLSDSGKLNVADVDHDEAFFVPLSQSGVYGNFNMDANGNWTYSLRNGDVNVQALAEGEQHIETFMVSSLDGTATQAINVTVVGTNDPAVITVVDASGNVKEDITLSDSGKLNISDVDTGQAKFIAVTNQAGTYGNFSMDVNGNWTYNLRNGDANVQALAEGEQHTETFTVSSFDGTATQAINVTVVGTNDPAVITVVDATGNVKEDLTLSDTGKLNITDVDTGQAKFIAVANQMGTYGNFSIDVNGNWTYTLRNGDANVQALTEGEQHTETFTVSSLDGTATQAVNVTVVGTNDVAVITGNAVGDVKEDGPTSDTGKLNITDVDTGQAKFVAITNQAGTYGNFSIDVNGNWTYSLRNGDANVQALNAGEQHTESFTVSSLDGTDTQVVNVNVVGNNDVAVITGNAAGSVKEDLTLSALGKLNITDVDTGQAKFITSSMSGTYGDFSIDANGNWTYSLHNDGTNVQALLEGETKQEIFTVKSSDFSASRNVTVNVVGTNDTAVITAVDDAGNVKEDVTLLDSGKLDITDVDTGQAKFKVITNQIGTYGNFSIDVDGNWTYTLRNGDANVQALTQSEQHTETFTVQSVDGSASHDVTVTVSGNNDTAVITVVDDIGNVKENVTISDSGKLNITDVDNGEAKFVAITNKSGTYGNFSIDANGNWTYTLRDSATNVQALGEGVQRTETFTVKSLDGTASHNVTVNVVGTNDAAVITVVDDVGNVKENVTTSDTGKLNITDVDSGQANFVAITSLSGVYGNFSITQNGTWTYALRNGDANVQALTEGEQHSETFKVSSFDGTATHDVHVTVVGTNDVAIITGNAAGDIKEEGPTTDTGKLNITDVDTGQAKFVAVANQAGTYGNFSMDVNGNWTYTLRNSDTNVQALAEGDQHTEIFTVQSFDGTDTQDVTVTVVGTNDVAVISGNATGNVKEDITLSDTGKLNITDVDTGQAMFIAVTNQAGTYGNFSMDVNGNWVYNLRNGDANVQALGEGVQRTDTFTVSSLDGSDTQAVNVTVVGTNDIAVISGDPIGNVKENVTTSDSGVLTVTDVDTGQAKFIAITNQIGTYGNFSITQSGTWTYTLRNGDANVQALTEGEQHIETFTVSSFDGTDTQAVNVTVVGTNDVTVITGNAAGNVKEDDITSDTGKLDITDADAGQAKFLAITNQIGTYGNFSIDQSGNWTYTLRNGDANVQALAEGEQHIDTFTVHSFDNSASQNVSITVVGTNDVAVISGNSTGDVKEDITLSDIGKLNVTDVDTGEAKFVTITNQIGTYGNFSIDINGNWTYTLRNGDANVQALAVGEQHIDTFTVSSLDGTDTQAVNVTVVGTNDIAVISGDSAGSVKENGTLSDTGKLNVTDVDTGEAKFIAITNQIGTYGNFSMDVNGNWTYSLRNGDANVQALAAGEQHIDTFTVHSFDSSASQNVNITVDGTNDAAVISGDATGTVKEDDIISDSGKLNITDVDTGQAKFIAISNQNGTYGDFSIDVNGNWTYNLHNDAAAVQALIEGEAKQDTFTVHSFDNSTTRNVVINIQGTDEGAPNTPPIAEDDSAFLIAQLVPGGTSSTNGNVLDNDYDPDNDVITVTTIGTIVGDYGSIVLSSNGDYVYHLNFLKAQQLIPGVIYNDLFTYGISDGRGGTASAQLDVEIIGIQQNLVKEDQILSVGGDLLELPAGQHYLVYSYGSTVDYGTFSINPLNHWTFTLNNSSSAVQSLNEGVSINLTFYLYNSSDFSEVQFITIKVQGTNDQAIFFGDGSGIVREDFTLSDSGKMNVFDRDFGESGFIPMVAERGIYGDFSIDVNGNWVYTLRNEDANVQALGTQAVNVDSFAVQSIDGTTRNIDITVLGNNEGNDAPTASSNSQTGYFFSGESFADNFADIDVIDLNDVLSYNLTSPPAGLTVNSATGTVSYNSFTASRHFKTLNGTSIRATDSFGAQSPLVALSIVFDPTYYSSIQFGTTGNNSLTASSNQVLIGMGGDDVFIGSTGNDFFSGITGPSTHNTYQFDFTPGHMGNDTILEFNDFRDTLQFQGAADITEVNEGITSFSNNGGAVQINFDNGGSLTLVNILYSSLTNAEKAAHDIMSLMNGANVNPGLISLTGETFSNHIFTYLYGGSLQVNVTEGGSFTNNNFTFESNFGDLTLISGSDTQTLGSTLSSNFFTIEQSLSKLTMFVNGGDATASLNNNTITFLDNTVVAPSGLNNAYLIGDVQYFLYSATNGGVAHNNTITFGADTFVGSTAGGIGGFTSRMYGDLGSVWDLIYGQPQLKIYNSIDGFITDPTNHILEMGGNTFIANSHNNIMFGIGGNDIVIQHLHSDDGLTANEITNGINFWKSKGYNTIDQFNLGAFDVDLVTRFEPVGTVVNPNTFVFNLGGAMGSNSIGDFSMEKDILEFHGVAPGATIAETIQNIDAKIASITGPGPGWTSTWYPFAAQEIAYIPGTIVHFTNGGTINFGSVVFDNQTSIAELVNHNTQIHAVLV